VVSLYLAGEGAPPGESEESGGEQERRECVLKGKKGAMGLSALTLVERRLSKKKKGFKKRTYIRVGQKGLRNRRCSWAGREDRAEEKGSLLPYEKPCGRGEFLGWSQLNFLLGMARFLGRKSLSKNRTPC